jgi:hypothetical protein
MILLYMINTGIYIGHKTHHNNKTCIRVTTRNDTPASTIASDTVAQMTRPSYRTASSSARAGSQADKKHVCFAN